MIAAGRTLGIFYVESPATRQLLQKMRAGDYERLVIASSIIRPAANRWIREFVKRLHGAPYRPLTPRLEKTLEETCGIMVYQEDVSRVVIDAAGFSAGEADQLRKILSKKDRALRLPDFRERFFRGGAERGVPRQDLELVWEMILSFEGYSFCKAHSASYALVSYKLAHLKRCYPLEFFTAVINNGGGFYSRQTYLNEVRRLGFPILAPDVNCERAGLHRRGRAGAARGPEPAARPAPGVPPAPPGGQGAPGPLRRFPGPARPPGPGAPRGPSAGALRQPGRPGRRPDPPRAALAVLPPGRPPGTPGVAGASLPARGCRWRCRWLRRASATTRRW